MGNPAGREWLETRSEEPEHSVRDELAKRERETWQE